MIYFLVEWKKDNPRTWSGTCYGLYTALKRKTQLIDVNISRSFIVRAFHKILSELHICNMGISNRKAQLAKVKKLITDPQAKIFQFAEVVPSTGEWSTYIYQDLSVSYVKYMAENLPDVFSHSSFYYDKSYINRRVVLQNQFYQDCSGIFAMGKWLAKDLIERCGYSPDKVHHVGGGINLDKERIDYSQKQGNKLLFVGRDFKRKGGHIVYEAFCHLKSTRPDVELYVAGPASDPYPNNAVSGYHYMGDCNRSKLTGLFNLCDVFVMPSYFEAYGLVFIEALTFGLPCIGRNAYEMPYFIEDGVTGRLLERDDTKQLSALMSDLLDNEDIKQNVRKKKEWYIKEYSWDSVAERIIKIME